MLNWPEGFRSEMKVVLLLSMGAGGLSDSSFRFMQEFPILSSKYYSNCTRSINNASHLIFSSIINFPPNPLKTPSCYFLLSSNCCFRFSYPLQFNDNELPRSNSERLSPLHPKGDPAPNCLLLPNKHYILIFCKFHPWLRKFSLLSN